MSGEVGDGSVAVSHREVHSFATSLYSYFNHNYEIEREVTITSKYFQEVIPSAVFRIKCVTNLFIFPFLDQCGHGVGKGFLCWVICERYPNDNYFKKLYFMTAFILQMQIWSHRVFDRVSPSLGSHLWKKIFLGFFKSEFRSHGGWKGFAKAAFDVLAQGTLRNQLRDTFLPEPFLSILQNVGELKRICEVGIEPTEIGIASGFEMTHISDSEEDEEENQPCPPAPGGNVNPLEQIFKQEAPILRITSPAYEASQPSKSEERIEKNLPETTMEVEESKKEIEENQPREVGVRPSLKPPAPVGNVSQTKNPLEAPSEKLRERDFHMPGSSNPQKRKLNIPVHEKDQASKSEKERGCGKVAKVEKSEEEVERTRPNSPPLSGNQGEGTSEKSGDSSGSNPLKRGHRSPPQSDSATDILSPSKAKMDRK